MTLEILTIMTGFCYLGLIFVGVVLYHQNKILKLFVKNIQAQGKCIGVITDRLDLTHDRINQVKEQLAKSE